MPACMSPCVVYVCWWERPFQSTILQTQCFTQGGLARLRHYITRAIVSRPNLSQWTIPLPEFMFCPEEEAGETKQTCGEVYRFWGESITKHRVEDLFLWLDIWLSWYFCAKGMPHIQRCRDEMTTLCDTFDIFLCFVLKSCTTPCGKLLFQ